jgi:hypothetical protein
MICVFRGSIVKELLAPTFSLVRKKIATNDLATIEESPTGEDEDEEDPMVTRLEQDEAETESETQRKRYMDNFLNISSLFFN